MTFRAIQVIQFSNLYGVRRSAVIVHGNLTIFPNPKTPNSLPLWGKGARHFELQKRKTRTLRDDLFGGSTELGFLDLALQTQSAI
jgi:hypothetical protein